MKKNISDNIELAKIARAQGEAVDRFEELEEQNKKLLGLLENIVEEYYSLDNGRTLRWAVEEAELAIAKAKGEE